MQINMLQRRWINQPSKLQPDHDLHGTNVFLLNNDPNDKYCDVLVVKGSFNTMRIAKLSLSNGWLNNFTVEYSSPQ